MQWILCYDIHHNSRRQRACRLLRRSSSGYQNSGFEIMSVGMSTIEPVLTGLAPLIDEKDSLLVLRHLGVGPDWQLGTGATTQKAQLLAWT